MLVGVEAQRLALELALDAPQEELLRAIGERGLSATGVGIGARQQTDHAEAGEVAQDLEPGGVLVWERGRVVERRRWWEPAFGGSDGAAGDLEELLRDSVRLRLRADVPVGAYLSGGLDSSVITALSKAEVDDRLQTFSVAFRQRAYSELGYARQVSSAIKADAHEVVIDERDFFGALPRLIWHEDEPIAHTSSVRQTGGAISRATTSASRAR